MFSKICLCSLRNTVLFPKELIFFKTNVLNYPTWLCFKNNMHVLGNIVMTHATMFKKRCLCSLMKMVVFFKELFFIKTNVLNWPLGLCSLGKCLFMKQIH